MDVRIEPRKLCGTVYAPASKSVAHRMLICAALSKEKSEIKINKTSQDIDATINCLRGMGVKIGKTGDTFTVCPPERFPEAAALDCGESGSTLRFLLPVAAALGISAEFTGRGRLPQRPLEPLLGLMREHGVCVSDGFPVHIGGRLHGGKFVLSGAVSSQFVTGLLLALPLCPGKSEIELLPPVESRPYIEITRSVMQAFGVKAEENGNVFSVESSPFTGGSFVAEGDWSNAAFLIACGAQVKGLNPDSVQGDRKFLEIIKAFGAQVREKNGSYEADFSETKGIVLDASDVPDLVPVAAAIAAAAQGETVICNASRLRLKESDRIASTVSLVNSLGGCARATDDGLVIKGRPQLEGGAVDSFGDHRIVMAAAAAALKCRNSVTITGAQAIKKSYPDFFDEYNFLGGCAYVL